MTERSRFAVYRDRLRGGPPRELAPHGTRAAARRHIKAGEAPCALCVEALRVHQHEQYELRKQRRANRG